MPKATVDPEVHHRELKTLPGGYVDLRTLSFHEMKLRQQSGARMYQEEKVKNIRKRGGAPQDDEEVMRGYFEVMNVAMTEFEFRNCVVGHNLYIDDAETQLIDFTKPMHTWKLDPKIGTEIGRYIDELNQESEEEAVGPLPSVPFSSSSIEETQPSLSTAEN